MTMAISAAWIQATDADAPSEPGRVDDTLAHVDQVAIAPSAVASQSRNALHTNLAGSGR
jgi:hypothetical protein